MLLTTIIGLIVGLGITWGGAFICIYYAMRKK